MPGTCTVGQPRLGRELSTVWRWPFSTREGEDVKMRRASRQESLLGRDHTLRASLRTTNAGMACCIFHTDTAVSVDPAKEATGSLADVGRPSKALPRGNGALCFLSKWPASLTPLSSSPSSLPIPFDEAWSPLGLCPGINLQVSEMATTVGAIPAGGRGVGAEFHLPLEDLDTNSSQLSE